MGAGTLEVESAGQDGESRFSHVRHPDGVQQEIYRQMEAHTPQACGLDAERVRPASRRAAAPRRRRRRRANIPEQLRQLADLRDSGVISAAEFEAKKAQLLERM